jgi:O-succinylbenzoic acid--CoA ligase
VVAVPELVALMVPAGERFVQLVDEIWSRGDAFAPIDPRLPPELRQEVLDVVRPTSLMSGEPGAEWVRRLPRGREVEPGDALVIATSGSSGRPKAVIHTHQSIAASARATTAALDVDPAADRWLACLPLAHIGGLSVVLRSLVTGTGLEVHDGFDAEAVTDAARRGATLVSLVTRALNRIDPGLFRIVLIGGAAPPADRAPNVVTTYGMTETGSGIVYGYADGRQQVLDGCEIRLVDGEIQLRGPMLFRGYRASADPFVDDGWYPTGDLGSWTGTGQLHVQGRAGDVIVTGGEKVWPEPIERLLAERDDIDEVALVGVPDPDWGHRVVAVMVANDRRHPPTLPDVATAVKERYPAWCAPKELVLVDALPRTSLGKIRRSTLIDTLLP